MSASALYLPSQALLDGNRHRNQIYYSDALWRTQRLTACHSASQRAFPELFLGKLISLWTMIWTCAAPSSSLRVRRCLIGPPTIYAIINTPFGTSDREFDGPLFRPGPHEPSALPWPSHSIKPPTPKSLAVVPIDFGLLLSQQCYAASAVRGDETFLRPHVSLCKDD